MGPDGCLVVEGVGFQASVQDSNEVVSEPAEGVVVLDAVGGEFVVEGSGDGRGLQGREGLRVERVDEPVVADEAGGDDLLFLTRG